MTGSAAPDRVPTVERILDAAIAELAERPEAGMGEVAARAEVGRATLYRYFPTRADLGRAIHDRAIREAEAAILASRPEEGPADAALERLVIALADVVERYVLLTRDEEHQPPVRDGDRLRAHVVALIERGQREGALRPDPAPQVVAEMLKGMLMGACAHGGPANGPAIAQVLLGGLRADA